MVKVILLFGPTGVGKTDLLDRLFNGRGEIISADSMQVYKGMDIGTAKPTAAMMTRLPHHLIDIRTPAEQFHAGDFLRLAEEAVHDISGRGLIPVISGGTAFYFKNFLYGLPDTPPSSPEIRMTLEAECAERGLPALHEALKRVDPVAGERIAPRDAYRILRALEVFRASGKPLTSFDQGIQARNNLDCLTIGLDRPREELYSRIDQRVGIMLGQGLEAEIHRLFKEGWTENDPGMKGIGYREFCQAARSGCSSKKQIISDIQMNSRRYAKRQITFFSSFADVHKVHPGDFNKVEKLVEDFLKV